MNKRIFMMSLGCAKNLVDSEQMLARLITAGYEIVDDPDEAELALINTCAFIEDAKRESIDVILETAKCTETGVLKGLIVAGCLAQRYGEEILKELPEVNALIGCGSFSRIVEVCDTILENAENGTSEPVVLMDDINAPVEECARVQTTPDYFAYMKIAEGCDNHCAYCVIPSLRGCYRSRRFEDIVEEAHNLAQNGVRELILVAQDVSRYGIDLYGRCRLGELLDALNEIEDLHWIRVHYLYPDEIDDSIIDAIARNEKVVKYIDMPIQHVSNHLLESMNRRYTKEELETLIRTLRKRIPGLVLRTSVIVGLPGETQDDFALLCNFIERQKLDKVGVFRYSQEEGTPAAEMPDQVDEDVKLKREETLLEVQSRNTVKRNEKLMGKILEVLVEGYDRAGGCFFGRSAGESPDIDGKIFFLPSDNNPKPGDFAFVRITDDLDGDLVGELSE